ncbi:hypothetical protein EON64_20995, partial [archaeon]
MEDEDGFVYVLPDGSYDSHFLTNAHESAAIAKLLRGELRGGEVAGLLGNMKVFLSKQGDRIDQTSSSIHCTICTERNEGGSSYSSSHGASSVPANAPASATLSPPASCEPLSEGRAGSPTPTPTPTPT